MTKYSNDELVQIYHNNRILNAIVNGYDLTYEAKGNPVMLYTVTVCETGETVKVIDTAVFKHPLSKFPVNKPVYYDNNGVATKATVLKFEHWFENNVPHVKYTIKLLNTDEIVETNSTHLYSKRWGALVY